MAILGKVPRPDRPHRRGRRRRRLRSLAFAPTLLSVGNLICGFAAIHFALRALYDFGAGVPIDATRTLHNAMIERMLPSFLSVGAGLVLMGMVLDCFDGLVARATQSMSTFGAHLDSLADVVTCGVAPATLMVAFMTKELARAQILPSPISEHFLGRAAWVAAAVYVAFAAIRLARFNVEHEKTDFDHRTFNGLPSPGAAAVIVAFVILQDQMGETSRRMIAYTLPVVALAMAFLMVSRIPYRRFHRAYLIGRQPFGQFVMLMGVLAVFWSYKAPTLMVIVLWYAASGPVFLVLRKLRQSRANKVALRAASDPAATDRKSA